jgi:hypothetical protein
MSLAEARQVLLEHAGCAVTTVAGSKAAMLLPVPLQFDVVMIGHAAPLGERRAMVQWARENAPNARIISLFSRVWEGIELGDSCADALEPETILKAIVSGGPGENP